MYTTPFDEMLMKEIRSKFSFLDYDPKYGKRIFLDNSGGSFRLTSSIIERNKWDLLPDCPERFHSRAGDLNELMNKAKSELLETVFGADEGTIITGLTASQIMFQVMQTITENVPGKNIITTNLEHPSAYDAAKMHAEKLGLELRIVKANSETGFINPEDVAALVDEDTILVSIIAASNISGNIMDLDAIGKAIHKKKEDVYFISDMVQHLPHGSVDVKKLNLDFINFAPYKFFGTRGVGIGYASPRVEKLPHHKLLGADENRWDLGSPTPSLYASILEIIDYVCWLGGHFINSSVRRELFLEGMEKIAQRERFLLQVLLEGDDEVKGLRHMDGVQVFVDGDDFTKRDLIVAMEIEGFEHSKAVKAYEKRGVTVYERVISSIYSKRILEALNLTGAIRVSPLHCQTVEDIREFLMITQSIVESVKKENV